MSIINNLFKGKAHNIKNNSQSSNNTIQDVAEDGTKLYLGSESLTWDAQQRKNAIENGYVKPSMAYSQQEQIVNPNIGVWETDETVENQVNLRENTPQ